MALAADLARGLARESTACIYSKRQKIKEANCPENGVSNPRELVLMIEDQCDEIDGKLN
jgi:hypothetical protein